MLAVLGTLGALVGTLRWVDVRFAPDPELPRKALHVGMGLVTLTFPWVFAERWPVVVLAALATAALLGVRSIRALRSGLGSVLHGVDRASLGELYFPAGVATVFVLSFGRPPVFYVIPVLMLTLADATAAFVGIRYGHPRLVTAEEPKSAEGSIAFFTVAFLSALVPLQLSGLTGRAETLLIALILGLLVAMLEVVAWHGLDNLLIPVGGYLFLVVHVDADVGLIALRLAVLAALVAFGLVWRRRTTLSHRGILTAALAAYTFWALGGWPFVIAPLALFLTYALIPPLTAEERTQVHDARIVGTNVAAGLAWVFVAAAIQQPWLLYPFSVAFAAHLAMNSLNRLARHTSWSRGLVVATAVLKGCLFVVLPWYFLQLGGVGSPELAAVACVLTAVAAMVDLGLERLMGDAPSDPRRGWAQAAVAFALSLVAYAAAGRLG
jgi:phytol kinase